MSSKNSAVFEKTKSFLLKNTMIIALALVYLFFILKSEGRMFLPQNVNNLIMQNSYVVILAVGMLLCILRQPIQQLAALRMSLIQNLEGAKAKRHAMFPLGLHALCWNTPFRILQLELSPKCFSVFACTDER